MSESAESGTPSPPSSPSRRDLRPPKPVNYEELTDSSSFSSSSSDDEDKFLPAPTNVPSTSGSSSAPRASAIRSEDIESTSRDVHSDGDGDGDNDNSNSTQQISTILECYICHEVCVSPIYVCQTQIGHLICGLCYGRLAGEGVPNPSCPCTGDLTHCPFAERLSYQHSLRLPCPFKKSGCSPLILATELLDHKECCEYRDLTCKMASRSGNGKCNELTPLWKFAAHVRDVHDKIISIGREGTKGFLVEPFIQGNQRALEYWKGLHSFLRTVIQFDSQTFLLHVVRRKQYLHWWFTILSDSKSAEKYKVETRILEPSTVSNGKTMALAHLSVEPYHKHAHFNKHSPSQTIISAARLTRFCLEESKYNVEGQMFKISWNFVTVSESERDQQRGQKRRMENELPENSTSGTPATAGAEQDN